jgi:hypothetical protein
MLQHFIQENTTGCQLFGKDFDVFHLCIVLKGLASFATKFIVSVRRCPGSQFEEIAEVFGTEGIHLLFIIHNGLQALLGKLTLKDLFFDRSGGQKSIGEASFLLSVSPASSGGLKLKEQLKRIEGM